MRALLELLSVPVAVIVLIAILGIAGGIENGTISLFNGVCAFGFIGVCGYLVYRIIQREEETEDGKSTDE